MKFKTQTSWERAFHMSPIAIIIMADMAYYCRQNKLPFVITETFTTESEDRKVNRSHSCHREGRAFDVSFIGWTMEKANAFMKFFEDKWGHIGAVSASTGQRNLVELHNGTALHFHVQIAKTYAVKANLEEKLYA